MSDIFRDLARDFLGMPDVPETVPLKVLGLKAPMPDRAAIQTAFRRRVIEVHPDLQLAYDHPVLQPGADDALGAHPEIRELVWARDVLMEMAPADVTDRKGHIRVPVLPVTKKARTCAKCQRELLERECWAVGWGPHRSRRRGWCYECVRADDTARAAARRRQRRANKHCAAPGCTTIFTPSRSDGRYCSPRCRQMAYRCRVTAKRGSDSVPPITVTTTNTQQEASR
jgi:hypothetical protein